MRQMVVLQSGQTPLSMGRPFFIVDSTASFISFLLLHLTQYASAIRYRLPGMFPCSLRRLIRTSPHPN